MSKATIELSRIIRVHYGAALKENDRVQTGPYAVYGSSGLIGHHDKPLFEYPSIIIGRKGSVGKVTYAPLNGWAIDTAFYVERIEPAECHLRYIFHALSASNLAQHEITTSIPGLSRDDIYRTRIRFPKFAEQQRIADILDKADAIRRKRKEAIALTEELLRSTFLEIFGDPVTNPKGWEVKPLGDLADIASGVAKGKKYDSQATITLPYMRVANVQDGHLVLDEIKAITVSEEEGRRYRLRFGDVLLTEGGDPDKLGRGTVWRNEIPDCIHQNHIFRVRPGNDVRAEYLNAIIGSERGKRYFFRAAKQTTGIASINMTQLRGFPVLVPPIPLQEKYASFVARLEVLRGKQQRKNELVNELFGALVQKAFVDTPAR